MAFLLVFSINFLLTFIIIKFSGKVKNPVRDFVPKTESEKVKISPFGGVAMFISSLVGCIIFVKELHSLIFLIPTFLALLLGLFDDLKKIFSKNYKGISAKFKIFFQVIMAIITYFICQNYNSNFNTLNFIVPFFGFVSIQIPIILAFIICCFAFIGTTNAMNLTDGLDGLAGKQAFIILIFLLVLIYSIFSENSDFKLIIMCFLGALTAFLMFNTNPAKIFMGDAGSMMLGSFIATLFIALRIELMLIFVGFIIFIEALSVMLQVGYFKLTKGKRIFKMSPIHHHFQLNGMKEQKITELAFLITFVISALFLTPFF